jgi:osmotically-inducible protein OsmY
MDSPSLERNVAEELLWDQKIGAESIKVSAGDDGSITLRGTVGSFPEKREAKKAAERVHGVTSVTDDLEVRLPAEHSRADANLRADVVQALMLDALVPTTIDVTVRDGVVTLTGFAERPHQRREAEFIAGTVAGVTGVESDIDLVQPTPNASEVQSSIKKALERNANVDPDNLEISVSDGTVTLSGSVRSWSEHDAAVAVAWTAPGVTKVRDHLTISY